MTIDELDTEQRLRRLEDLGEITQTYIDYANHLDNWRFDELVELFTEDAQIKFQPGPPVVGRDAIDTTIRRMAARVEVGTAYHIMSNPTVDLRGDEASGTILWTVIEHTSAGVTTVAVGEFGGRFVRCPDRWRMQRLSGRVLVPRMQRVDADS